METAGYGSHRVGPDYKRGLMTLFAAPTVMLLVLMFTLLYKMSTFFRTEVVVSRNHNRDEEEMITTGDDPEFHLDPRTFVRDSLSLLSGV